MEFKRDLTGYVYGDVNELFRHLRFEYAIVNKPYNLGGTNIDLLLPSDIYATVYECHKDKAEPVNMVLSKATFEHNVFDYAVLCVGELEEDEIIERLQKRDFDFFDLVLNHVAKKLGSTNIDALDGVERFLAFVLMFEYDHKQPELILDNVPEFTFESFVSYMRTKN